MKICDILKEDKIVADYQPASKEDAINKLISLFENDMRVTDIEKVKNSVLEREKILSTGVGSGFAIPHGKTEAVTEIIAAFGRIPEPIDFEALDGNPVNLVFLLIGKENLVGPHIKLLSRISRMMKKDEFRQALADAKTSSEIYNIFLDEEKNYIEIN